MTSVLNCVKPSHLVGNLKRDRLNVIEEINEILENIETRLPIEMEVTVPPKTFVVTKDMSSIIVGSKKGNLMVYDTSTNELTRENDKSNSAITSIALSTDESMLLLADKGGMLCLISYPSLSHLGSVQLPEPSPAIVKAIGDNSFIVSSSQSAGNSHSNIYKLIYNEEIMLQQLLVFRENINCFEVQAFDIYIGLNSGRVKIFNQETQSRTSIFHQEDDLSIDYLSLSHSGKCLAVGLGQSEEENPEAFSIVILDYKNRPQRNLRSHTSKITGLEFIKKDEYLISSSKDANILLWKVMDEHKVMNFFMYNSPVTCIRSFGNTLFAAQKKNVMTIWDIPPLPKRSKLVQHQHEITQIEFFRSKKQAVTIDSQGLIVIWNLETESVVDQYDFNRKLSGFSLSRDNSFCLVATEEPCLYKLHLKDMSTEVINTDSHFDCFKFCSHGESVLTGDNKNRLIEWQLPNFKNSWTMKGHHKQINFISVLNSLNTALTASKDFTINYWDLSTHKFLGRFIGHTDSVTCVKASKDNKNAFSASLDCTVRIWDISSCRLIYTLQSDLPILCMKISTGQKYMITGNENSITYWDLLMHTEIANVPFPEKASVINRSSKDGSIAVGAKNIFYILNDPLVSGNFEVVGQNLDYQYKFMKYVYNMMYKTDEFISYLEEFNSLVFAPSFINILHCFVSVNNNSLLKSCLKSETNTPGLFHSQKGHNALNLSIDYHSMKCTNIVLKYMSQESENNMKLLYPLNVSLSKLNLMNLKYLPELYNWLMKKSKASYLPKVAPDDTKLPIYHLEDSMIVLKESFDISGQSSEKDSNIVFKSSVVEICLVPGSSGSVSFLKSLKDSPQPNILNSEFVEHILDYKWKKLRYFVYAEALFYLFYLIFLFMHSYIRDDLHVFALLGLMHLILTIIELANLVVERMEFFTCFWNYIDISRIIFCFVYAYYFHIGEDESLNGKVIYVMVVFTSGFRGISYFRVFQATRYIVNLILEVFKDMRAFLILFFYATMLFGLIMTLMPVYPNTPALDQSYIEGFSIDIIQSDTDHFEFIDWVFYSLANIICPITMLNILIAIISDTYERVQDTYVIADRLELLDMILECERLMFMNKDKNKRYHIQVCAEEDNTSSGDQEWKGKVREIKRMFKESKKEMQIQNDDIKEMCSKMNNGIINNQKNIEEIKGMIKRCFGELNTISRANSLRSVTK